VLKSGKLICKKKYKGHEFFGDPNDFILKIDDVCYVHYDEDIKDLSYMAYRNKEDFDSGTHIFFFIAVNDVPEYFYTEKQYRKIKLEKINKVSKKPWWNKIFLI